MKSVTEKRLATLKAELALRGFAVHDTVTGGWLVAKWDQSHYCAHLVDLEAFARRVTFVNPDTALFAGIVHEVGGFYLLSRADEFPGLLDDDPEKWAELCEDVVSREVLRKLAVPEPVADAIVQVRGAWLNMPPESLTDTLLLANQYADVNDMAKFIGVDSLAFLSIDGLYRAVGGEDRNNARPQFTDHYFTGDYPTRLLDKNGESLGSKISVLASNG